MSMHFVCSAPNLHVCRRHKVLHIPGGWWPWPSAICCCLSVLEDVGSLLVTYKFCVDPIWAGLLATLCGPLLISRASDSQ